MRQSIVGVTIYPRGLFFVQLTLRECFTSRKILFVGAFFSHLLSLRIEAFEEYFFLRGEWFFLCIIVIFWSTRRRCFSLLRCAAFDALAGDSRWLLGFFFKNSLFFLHNFVYNVIQQQQGVILVWYLDAHVRFSDCTIRWE